VGELTTTVHVLPIKRDEHLVDCYHSFIHQWLCSSSLGPGLFFSLVILSTQTVGLLGRVISPSQGLYLHTGQHKHRKNAQTDIHTLSGIRTHYPSIRAGEHSSYLRPRGQCDRLLYCHKICGNKLFSAIPVPVTRNCIFNCFSL
jgi:hypothetical protein